MSEKDDNDWFNTLAGKQPSDADPSTVREAKTVRRAALKARDADENAPPSEAGLQRLLFRLHREGLLERRARPWWRSPVLLTGLAASLTLAVVLPQLMTQKDNGSDLIAMRGHVTVQTLYVDDPVGAAEKFNRELTALGIAPQTQATGQGVKLSATLPASLNEGLRALLARHQLSAPPQGALMVEWRHSGE